MPTPQEKEQEALRKAREELARIEQERKQRLTGKQAFKYFAIAAIPVAILFYGAREAIRERRGTEPPVPIDVAKLPKVKTGAELAAEREAKERSKQQKP